MSSPTRRFTIKNRLKIAIVFIALAVVFSIGGGLGYAFFFGGSGNCSADLQQGLVGWWKMDGNAKDATPNSNNGTVTGATLTTDRKGQTGKAYSFNGTSDHISVGNAGSGIKTIAFWMQADDTTARKIIDIDRTDQIELDGSSAITATSFPGTIIIYVDGAVASAIADTNWHFVAITDTTGVTPSAMDIGAVSASYFSGKLDDVRMYNRVLSAAEITALYQEYNPGIEISSLQKGLLMWLKFDNNSTKDATANTNKGGVTEALSVADRKGQADKALSFDGVDDIVTVSPSVSLRPSIISIAAWIKPTDTGTGRIVSRKTGGSPGSGYVLELTATLKPQFRISALAQDYPVTATDAIAQDAWSHVVATFDGAAMQIYINGVANGAPTLAPGTVNYTVTTTSVTIGGISEFFAGSLDDVRMYNRALSAAEVLALYQEYDSKIAISTLQSGLVGRWIGSPADSTSITRDQTPQGNNGTDRKSTRLNSSHSQITHAVFFFKKT